MENSPARAGMRHFHKGANVETHQTHCLYLPVNMARIKQLLAETWNVELSTDVEVRRVRNKMDALVVCTFSLIDRDFGNKQADIEI